MADEPPVTLTDLLAKLHLATPEQVRAVGGRARKLARDLPLFDSVWIDALAQVRLLTPFQAAEINAGRGEQLLVGPYVLQRRIQRLGYAECFLAAGISSEDKTKSKSRPIVQLVVVRGMEPSQAAQAAAELQAVVERIATVKADGVVPLRAVGFADGVLWAAYDSPSGFPLDQWLPCHGRLPPVAALEVARQMVVALAALEKAALVHGEIGASSLCVTDAGDLEIVRCGVWEAVSRKGSIADEMYACGLLWWHLLAGRPPLAGGNGETKLQAARAAKIPDIRQIAPDVAGTLATVIERCTQRDPALRPQSFDELKTLLGPPSAAGRRRLVLELVSSGRRTSGPAWPRRVQSAMQRAGQPLLAAAACTLLLAAATWPFWRPRHPANELSKVSSLAAGNDLHRPRETQPNLAIFERRDNSNNPQLSKRDQQDRDIRQANYQTTGAPARPESQSAEPPARPIIELSGATEIAGSTLRLQRGAMVRGKEGERPRITMPPNGLVISVDHVQFENVDFVWRQRAEEITSPDRHALIDLRAAQAEFAGCTFQAQAVGSFELPAAIRLNNNLQRGAALAPAVHVQLDRCVLEGVTCGVDCLTRGPAAITARNTLYLGRGPLVRFHQARPADASTAITLEHITLRGATAAVELNCDDTADSSGTVVLNTAGCVLAPEESGALVAFSGRQVPKTSGGTLAALDWSCQDSLVSPGTAIAMWQHDQTHETLPDDELPLEGLVASPFDFAGAATSDPGNSRLKRWLAPMRTELTPGIGDDLPRLPEMQ